MPYLVCYDIASDKIRLKAAKKLLASGFVRFQKSVFVSDLHAADEIADIHRWMEGHIQRDTDKIMSVFVSPNQLKSIYLYGETDPDMLLLILQPGTLIL